MTAKVLTADDVSAASALVTLLGRVKLNDRALVAVLAISDLGNLPVVGCTVHDDNEPSPHTFSAAVAHMRTATSRCALVLSLSDVEVQS